MVLAADAECSHKVMHIHRMIKNTTFFLSVFGLIERSALLANPFITRISLGKKFHMMVQVTILFKHKTNKLTSFSSAIDC
jgi:hypothetical protein